MTRSLRSQAVDRSIAIAGCARSGTSILGSLIATAREVEYMYDPAVIHQLIHRAQRWPQDEWKHAMEVFIYDEFLLNMLAGRTVNQNHHDLSNYIALKGDQVLSRLEQRNNRKMLEDIARTAVAAFKVTDLNFAFQTLSNAFPSMRKVAIVRSPAETIQSLLAKHWFAATEDWDQGYTPLIDGHARNGVWVPAFLRADEEKAWLASSEEARCHSYYLRANEALLEVSHLITLVDYSRLVENAKDQMDRLFSLLGIHYGERTESWIATVRPNNRPAHTEISPSSSNLYSQLSAMCI